MEHQLFHYLYLPSTAVCNVHAHKTASFHNLKCYGRYKYFSFLYHIFGGGHGGRVVTLLPPTSEAGVRFKAVLQVGYLVVAFRWSVVYSTEP